MMPGRVWHGKASPAEALAWHGTARRGMVVYTYRGKDPGGVHPTPPSLVGHVVRPPPGDVAASIGKHSMLTWYVFVMSLILVYLLLVMFMPLGGH